MSYRCDNVVRMYPHHFHSDVMHGCPNVVATKKKRFKNFFYPEDYEETWRQVYSRDIVPRQSNSIDSGVFITEYGTCLIKSKTDPPRWNDLDYGGSREKLIQDLRKSS